MKKKKRYTKHITDNQKFTLDVSDSGSFTINIQDSQNFTVNLIDCKGYTINQQDCVDVSIKEEAEVALKNLPHKQSCKECICERCFYKADCCPECEGAILGCEEYLEMERDKGK